METNKSNEDEITNHGGYTNGNEEKKENEEVKHLRRTMNMKKPNVRELLYGLIVIFLLLTVYIVGQMQTMMLINYISDVCPTAQITSVSPLTGVSFIPQHSNVTTINTTQIVTYPYQDYGQPLP